MKLSVLRIALWVFFGVIVIGLFLPLLVSTGALVSSFLFGWVSFLQRIWPGVTVNWNGIGMVVFCSALTLAGVHSFGGWLFRSVAAKVSSGAEVRWCWSWTFALYLGVWLLFAAIMGAVGAAHQVGWLLRSDDPLYKPRRHLSMFRYSLRERAMNLLNCADEADWNLERTRTAFLEEQSHRSRNSQSVLEEFHLVFVEGTNGSLVAGLIFHRDVEIQAKAGFTAVTATKAGEVQPIEELASALAQYQLQTNLVSSSGRK